jgi:glutamine synthetase
MITAEHDLLIFLPKPIIGKGKSGHHVNRSFTDTKGHNAIANDERGDPNNLKTLASGCIAGWMKHHKALAR